LTASIRSVSSRQTVPLIPGSSSGSSVVLIQTLRISWVRARAIGSALHHRDRRQRSSTNHGGHCLHQGTGTVSCSASSQK
jgi:hypothetical protein